MVTQLIGADAVPDDVRRLCSLPTIDYADHITVPTDVDLPAERWARAMLGDSPDLVARLAWRGWFCLRLATVPTADTVAGWWVAAREPEWIRLEAASGFLSANIIVTAWPGQVSLSTRPWGRLSWAALLPLHRRVTPRFLASTEAKLRRTSLVR